MKLVKVGFLFGALMVASVQVALANEEVGSLVVGEDEACPDGMVVSGMGGGQGPVSKVCVRPNTEEMPEDNDNVGDPDTAEKEYDD